ncbi:RNA polymerase sigma factor [Terriglobus sp. ADX1]|uniref:RNA polymerase sigma factor n=1 Tax=Terriglobus sp. ADX1 TaxID=2794063 RepID=UPI002FE6BD52
MMVHDGDDATLMRSIAARDESALADLYDRHSVPLYSLIRRIVHDEAAAEEILQDVFLHVWKVAPRFDQARGQLRGWLLVMARNRALSHLRKRQDMQVDDLDVYAIPSTGVQETIAEQNELRAKIHAAIEEMPPELSQLFELAYFEGMTHSEIAQRTGQPLGTVKTRLRSGLTSLRRVFQP